MKRETSLNLSPLFALLQRGLFVATAPAPSRRSRSRSNITCAYGRCRLWWCCTARNHPELNAIFLTEATIDNDDPCLIDPALRHQIIPGTRTKQVRLADAAGATAVSNHVRCRCRVSL